MARVFENSQPAISVVEICRAIKPSPDRANGVNWAAHGKIVASSSILFSTIAIEKA
jgi:hypothetical protein